MKLKLRLVFHDQSHDIGCAQSRQFIASSTHGCIYLQKKDGARLSMYSLEKALLTHCLLLKEIKGRGRQSKLLRVLSPLLTFLTNKRWSQNVIRTSAIRQYPKFALFKSPAPQYYKNKNFSKGNAV
jgi:hypothetical protein